MWYFEGCVATGNEVSCGTGGVVQWHVCSGGWCVLIVGWVAGFRWPGDT